MERANAKFWKLNSNINMKQNMFLGDGPIYLTSHVEKGPAKSNLIIRLICFVPTTKGPLIPLSFALEYLIEQGALQHMGRNG